MIEWAERAVQVTDNQVACHKCVPTDAQAVRHFPFPNV